MKSADGCLHSIDQSVRIENIGLNLVIDSYVI